MNNIKFIEIIEMNIRNHLKNQVFKQLKPKIDYQIRNIIMKQSWSQLDNQLMNQFRKDK